MKVVVVGGGGVGLTIVKKLISENHDIIIIEKNEEKVKQLKKELDALIIEGSGININTILRVGIENTSLFLAVTNDDRTNILSCYMAKMLYDKTTQNSENEIIFVARVENENYHFNDKITPHDYGIDWIINPIDLFLERVLKLLDNPQAVEIIDFEDNKLEIIAIRIGDDFQLVGRSLNQLGVSHPILNDVRIIAIYRNGKLIIPKGSNFLYPNDKVYFIGKKDRIEEMLKSYFKVSFKIDDVIIIGGNDLGERLASILLRRGKRVVVIEENLDKCEDLSSNLKKALILNGTSTDEAIFNHLELEKACVISLTDNDEYNIISSLNSKEHNVYKTVTLIKNIALLPVINSMFGLDSVLFSQVLTAGEILHLCRKGNMISVTSFSEINAETIGILIDEDLPILNRPIKELKFPNSMTIGAIIRNEDVFIPKGSDEIKLGDKLMLFVLPNAIKEVEKLFSKKGIMKKKEKKKINDFDRMNR